MRSPKQIRNGAWYICLLVAALAGSNGATAQDEPIAKMDAAAVKGLMLEALPRIFTTFRREDIKRVHVFRTDTAATVLLRTSGVTHLLTSPPLSLRGRRNAL